MVRCLAPLYTGEYRGFSALRGYVVANYIQGRKGHHRGLQKKLSHCSKRNLPCSPVPNNASSERKVAVPADKHRVLAAVGHVLQFLLRASPAIPLLSPSLVMPRARGFRDSFCAFPDLGPRLRGAPAPPPQRWVCLCCCSSASEGEAFSPCPSGSCLDAPETCPSLV